MKKASKILLGAVSGAALAVVVANLYFQQRVKKEIREMVAQIIPGKEEIVTEEMLEGLPEPVRRYLTYSGIIGKPLVQTIRIRQVGKFRPGIKQPWMDLSAEQVYTVNPPGFIWKATLRMNGLPVLRVRDGYKNGKGHIEAKIGGIYPLFDISDEKLTQGAMVRYLSEMIWFPSAFLDKHVSWKAIDDHSAEAAFTDRGKSVSATLFFDEQGRLVNLIANRYSQATDSFETWSAPVDEYGERAGVRMGVRGRAVWNLPLGDLPYIDVELADVAYDSPIL